LLLAVVKGHSELVIWSVNKWRVKWAARFLANFGHKLCRRLDALACGASVPLLLTWFVFAAAELDGARPPLCGSWALAIGGQAEGQLAPISALAALGGSAQSAN